MSDAINQTADGGRYFLKRLRDGVNLEFVVGFLEILLQTELEEESKIEFSFPNLFQEISHTTLFYTKKNRGQHINEGENPNFFLYKSDLAYLFSDTVTQFLKSDAASLTAAYEKNAAQDTLKKLSLLVNYCQSHDSHLEINTSDDKYLNSVFDNDIKAIARFLLAALQEKPEEKEEETPDSVQTSEAAATAVVPAVSRGSTGTPESQQEEGGDGTQPSPDELPPEEVQRPDVLELKKKLFSPELRKEIVLFTDQAIAALETHYQLPPGTLQNSSELRQVLNQRTIGFFLTVIGDGHHQNLLSISGSEQLASEYQWLLQNDFKFKEVLGRRFSELTGQQTDPQTLENIQQALTQADQGEDVSQVFQDLMKQPEVTETLEKIAADPLAAGNTDYLVKESNQLLERELQNLGVSADKLALARTNVLNVVDSYIQDALDMGVLAHIDEGRFKLIFGEEIPYNPEFLQTLEEIWIARRSILGRATGTLLLHNEARFATQEAMDLLDKQKNVLSPQESDRVFVNGIVAPTQQKLLYQKALHASSAESISLSHGTAGGRPSYSYSPPVSMQGSTASESSGVAAPIQFEQRRQTFLKSVWENMDTPNRESLLVFMGYGEDGSKSIQNLASDPHFIPPQLGFHDVAPLLERSISYYDQASQTNYGSPYIPRTGLLRSPFSGVRSLQQKANSLKNLARRTKWAGRLGKKAAEKAAQKAAEAGLSTAASAAGTAVNPALGFLAKLATTKKGRQALIIGGGLGLASLVVPLFTLGGQIGAALGGIIGGIIGGPGGAVAGAISGGWTGYGIEKGIKNFFSGNGSSSFAGPPVEAGAGANLFPGGTEAAASTATQTASLQTLATSTFTTIGGQAVIGTIALVAGSVSLYHVLETNALLANFPVVDPLGSISPIQGKPSEFVTVEKRAFIAGCPENKCENPAFPIEVEYAVTITPKDNYTLTILDATDTLKALVNKEAWEEEGKTPPNLPDEVMGLSDFPELSPGMTILPGGSVTIRYTRILDEKYNHTTLTNTFNLGISAKDEETLKEGTDTAITGEVVYIGKYPQGDGCWPVSGIVTQVPGNPGGSHAKSDAYDIWNHTGTPIHTPFSGEACPGNIHKDYGIHVTVNNGQHTFIFAHLSKSFISSCRAISPGEIIGLLGNTGKVYGNNGGEHLHFGIYAGLQGNQSTLQNVYGYFAQNQEPVRSCYD